MPISPIHGLPFIEEDEAEGEAAEIFAQIKHDLQSPFVPSWAKSLAFSPRILKMYMSAVGSVFDNISLPQSLVAMICYAVASEVNCLYCAATNELTCRTLGVDEQTLSLILTDMSQVYPERTRAIIEFALKTAKKPQELVKEDYDALREHGISDEEMAEIMMVAALAVFNDVLADAFKVEVNPEIIEALNQ